MGREKSAVAKLAMDFERWGVRATKRIQRLTEQYGLPMRDRKISYTTWSNGKAG